MSAFSESVRLFVEGRRLEKVASSGFNVPVRKRYRKGWMLRVFVVLCLLGLLLPELALAGKYRQAAYITNLYFAERIASDEDSVQPERVFNRLRAGDPEVMAYMVLNLLLDRGEHQLEVDIMDREGTLFDKLKFDNVQASQDDWRYAATGQFGGELPEGGIFFRIYDSHDGGAKEVIGTVRLMTAH